MLYSCQAMVNEYFSQNMNDSDLDNMWTSQDGGTRHTVNKHVLMICWFQEMDLSTDHPSHDIDASILFLWDYVKSWVYANRPRTPDTLEANVVHKIYDIPTIAQNSDPKLDSQNAFCQAISHQVMSKY